MPPDSDLLASLGEMFPLPAPDPRAQTLTAMADLPGQPDGTSLAMEDGTEGQPDGTRLVTTRLTRAEAAEYQTESFSTRFGNVPEDFLVAVDPTTLDLALADVFKWKSKKKSPRLFTVAIV